MGRRYHVAGCWMHDDDPCPVCDPDPDEELRVVREMHERMFEHGGLDFTAPVPPLPGRVGDTEAHPHSRGASRRPTCDRRNP